MSTTSRNMNWSHKPFLLSPAGKDYLWGGDRLITDFHKTSALRPLAETWECSTHPDGTSIAASGAHTGLPLDQILREHPAYLGTHPEGILREITSETGARTGLLPVLIKLIDAQQNLSIQVHPDDAYAAAHENGSLGKTELWYVLDAKPGAQLIYGFNRALDPETLRAALQNGTIEKYLQKLPVRKDDVFLIEPGTVHAIGAGVLIAEIQESSNITYRLFDYDRLDKSGRKRPLHHAQAFDVLRLSGSDNPRQPMRTLRYRPGFASELLGRCKYFQVERLLVNTREAQPVDISTSALSFQVLLCLEGDGTLRIQTSAQKKRQEDEALFFQKGNCLFLPADSAPIALSGKAQLLRVSC